MDCIEFMPAKQVVLEVNTVIGDVIGSRKSKSIKLLSSDDLTWVADWVTIGSRV